MEVIEEYSTIADCFCQMLLCDESCYAEFFTGVSI